MKLLKKLIGIALLFIGIVLLAVAGILFFIPPDSLKPMISDQISKRLGRQIHFTQKLTWSFFPSVGIETRGILLDNAKNFGAQPMVQVGHVKINAMLLPLLTGKVRTDEVILSDVQIKLIKNKKGEANWQFQPGGLETSLAKTSRDEKKTEATFFSMLIPRIDLSNVTVDFQDEQTGQNVKLTHVSLQAKQVALDQFFPLKLSFELQLASPAFLAKTELVSQVRLRSGEVNFSRLDVNATLSGEAVSKQLNPVHINGDISVGQNYLKTSSLIMQLGSTKIIGDADLTDFSALTGRGSLEAMNVLFGKAKIDRYRVAFQADHGKISALHHADVYQGKFTANSATILNKPGMATDIHYQLQALNMGALNKDLLSKEILTGTAEAQGELQIQGQSGNDLLSHLQGKIVLAVHQGNMGLFDLRGLLSAIDSFQARGGSKLVDNASGTDFDSFKFSGHIKNGVLKTQDMELLSQFGKVEGGGSVSFVDKSLNLRFTAGSQTNQKSLRYTFNVTGTLDHPSTRLDMAEMAKQIATREINKVMENVLGGGSIDIKKLLG